MTENTTRNFHMLTIGFEPETFVVVPNSESTFESSIHMQRDGNFKSWNSSIAKEQVWTDDGQQFNSFFAHLLTWALCYETKPLLTFFVINKWYTIISSES